MNITYITEYFPYKNEDDITGGVESRCINIAKRISKKHNLTVITSWRKGQKRKHKINNIRVLRVGPNHKYSNESSIISRLNFAKAAYNLAKKVKADIVEGYNFTTYLPAYYAAKKVKAKKIATYHEVWINEWIKNKGLMTGIVGEIAERIILSLKWDKIIAVSNFTKKRIKNQNVETVYNGINPNKKQEKKYKKKTLITISRLTPHKRVQDLIKATYLLKKDNPNIKLIIIGKGEEENKLKLLTKKLKLNIEFINFVEDHENLIKILKKSHIFCLPSVLEGFGIVIVEAMASNTPYVCSDIEVLKEVTKNSKGGLIFKQKNPKDLANKIAILLKDKRLYKKKQKEAKELSKEYEWDTLANKINKIYENEIQH
ncbi:glycosyltransferase family 4 protein [Candidatus Woesearchaeota archaeon]|jgi:glycosyltransferase involved in cell wall biosynthesis|nr:glycosyltransferase family 4 protein [Candidatus Woesearchaeota archaeon]